MTDDRLRTEPDRPQGSALRTLLESLAREADELSRQLDKIADEAFITTSPESPAGRFGEGPPGAYGVHRAIVVGGDDPQGRHRALVRVPGVSGESAVWAEACLPPDGSGQPPGGDSGLPPVGATVWVLFEGGDPERPVWIGVLPDLSSG